MAQAGRALKIIRTEGFKVFVRYHLSDGRILEVTRKALGRGYKLKI